MAWGSLKDCMSDQTAHLPPTVVPTAAAFSQFTNVHRVEVEVGTGVGAASPGLLAKGTEGAKRI